MERIGNSAPEKGIGLGVEGLQRTGGVVHRNVAGHIQILVENKLHLVILLAVALDKAGAGMDLGPAAAWLCR